jgi:hypothetical protein
VRLTAAGLGCGRARPRLLHRPHRLPLPMDRGRHPRWRRPGAVPPTALHITTRQGDGGEGRRLRMAAVKARAMFAPDMATMLAVSPPTPPFRPLTRCCEAWPAASTPATVDGARPPTTPVCPGWWPGRCPILCLRAGGGGGAGPATQMVGDAEGHPKVVRSSHRHRRRAPAAAAKCRDSHQVPWFRGTPTGAAS